MTKQVYGYGYGWLRVNPIIAHARAPGGDTQLRVTKCNRIPACWPKWPERGMADRRQAGMLTHADGRIPAAPIWWEMSLDGHLT